MTRILAAIALLAVAGCASTEERTKQRFAGWAEACGIPLGQGLMTSDVPDWEAKKTCVLALEQSYQAERSTKVASGMAMLGYGTAMMATPQRSPSVNCTSSQMGVFTNTTCR